MSPGRLGEGIRETNLPVLPKQAGAGKDGSHAVDASGGGPDFG